jgi:hypothetical protein
MERLGRLFTWLFRIGLVVGLLAAGSFAGAQFKARQLLGPRSPISESQTSFAWKGVQDLPGKPRAWVFTYERIRLPGVRRVRIVVSPRGRILAVSPPDLREQLEAYRRSLEP